MRLINRFCIILFLVPITTSSFASELESTVGAIWESKYVSEGRDNLGKGGLFSFSADLSVSPFEGRIWYAVGDSENYRELNLLTGLRHQFGSLELGLSYTYLSTPVDSAHDHEFAVNATYGDLPLITPSIVYKYSTEASGGFLEFVLSSEQTVTESFSITPNILFASNHGYIPNEHEGANNLQTGVEFTYAIAKSATVTSHISYSWALDRETGETLDDLFWGGIGINFNF